MDADILKNRRAVWLMMGGRLKDGVSVRQADAEARTIGAALEREHPDDNRGKSFTLAGIGVAVGVAIAAAGSKLLESLLFGVRGLDPLTFGGACLLFAAVTLIASYVPARRALSVDPMIALRAE